MSASRMISMASGMGFRSARGHEDHALEVAAKKAEGLGTNDLVAFFHRSAPTVLKALAYAERVSKDGVNCPCLGFRLRRLTSPNRRIANRSEDFGPFRAGPRWENQRD